MCNKLNKMIYLIKKENKYGKNGEIYSTTYFIEKYIFFISLFLQLTVKNDNGKTMYFNTVEDVKEHVNNLKTKGKDLSRTVISNVR